MVRNRWEKKSKQQIEDFPNIFKITTYCSKGKIIVLYLICLGLHVSKEWFLQIIFTSPMLGSFKYLK